MLLRPAPSERAAYIEHAVRAARVIGSPGFPFDPERIRRRAAAGYDRCHYPAGAARQLAAIVASGDRTAALRSVRAPTVVIHGREDPLVPLAGGLATAAAIPGARLLVINGMGHDLPAPVWPQVVDAIAENARRALSAR